MKHEVLPIRVYVDTSVFGGVFDEGFAYASMHFFDVALAGRLRLVVSSTVVEEIAEAPEHVQGFALPFLDDAEKYAETPGVLALANAYIEAGIVPARWHADAIHIAVATVSRCAYIVSWNFKHMVNFRAMTGYNAVNKQQGYGEIAIHAPWEEVWDEEDV